MRSWDKKINVCIRRLVVRWRYILYSDDADPYEYVESVYAV